MLPSVTNAGHMPPGHLPPPDTRPRKLPPRISASPQAKRAISYAQFTPLARHDKTVLSVSCLACRCELNDCCKRVQTSTFSLRDSLELSGIQFKPPKPTQPVADLGGVQGVQTPALLFRCPFLKRTYFANMSLRFSAEQGAS